MRGDHDLGFTIVFVDDRNDLSKDIINICGVHNTQDQAVKAFMFLI
jgi:hypothetical protein